MGMRGPGAQLRTARLRAAGLLPEPPPKRKVGRPSNASREEAAMDRLDQLLDRLQALVEQAEED
jgi:hypothetical protein